MPHTLNAKYSRDFILNIIKPFTFPIFIMFLLGIFSAVTLSLQPYLLKIILDRLATAAQYEVFNELIGPICCYLSMNLFMSVMQHLYGYFVEVKMIPKMRERIADSALTLLLEQSHNYYQNNFAGNLTNKINDLTNTIPELLQIIVDKFFTQALALIIAVITLWQVNYLFAALMLSWILFFILYSSLIGKKIGTLSAAWSARNSKITGKLVDVLDNILSVRLFSTKSNEKNNINSAFIKSSAAEQRFQLFYFFTWGVFCGYFFIILQGVNLYFLCQGRQEGWLTVGDFALVLTMNIAITNFLWCLAREFSLLAKYSGKINQALCMTLTTPELTDKPTANVMPVTKGTIVFANVKFNYHDNEPLFKNKSITIPAGQKVGLVGYSGSGKSTFVNLILRLYDVTSGSICIDGHDIRDVTQDSFRANISMIPQDPSLFHRSIMDNIRYGRIDASDEEVIAAAKKAHADEFISKIPNGYHTFVGERGVKLSGGQRQRIAIARAILKNAPILILDEATSQLDSVTENYIKDSLCKLMEGKTTIVVAHRLSTLLHMDRILVFDQGKIVADGNHATLLASANLYKVLWNAQMNGCLPNQLSNESSI